MEGGCRLKSVKFSLTDQVGEAPVTKGTGLPGEKNPGWIAALVLVFLPLTQVDCLADGFILVLTGFWNFFMLSHI